MKEELMDNWEVMERAIPRGDADRVAAAMRKRGYQCSPDLVRRWKREPTSDESPEATGQASPLDKCNDLVEVLIVTGNRAGARLVVNHVNAHYQHLAYPDSPVLSFEDSKEERANAAAEILQHASAVAQLLTREGITRETVFKLVQLNDLVAEVNARANQDLLRAEDRGSSSTVREGAFA